MDSMNSEDPIERVKTFLDEGAENEALSLLNTLIEQDGSAVAHQMRFFCLLPDLKPPAALRESLATLREIDIDAYHTCQPKLEERLQERLIELLKQIEGCGAQDEARTYLSDIDALLVLADFSPAVYAVRGLAYMTAASHVRKPARKPNEKLTPYANLKQLLSEVATEDPAQSTSTPHEDDSTRQAWYVEAEQSFRMALTHLEAGHPLLAETYSALGALYEATEQHLKALTSYQQAAENGRQLATRIEALIEKLSGQAQTRLLTKIDQLLGAGEFQSAAKLIDTYCPEPIPADWRLRMAELALLSGDTAEAERHYAQLLSPTSSETENPE